MSCMITGSAFELRKIHLQTDQTSGITHHNAFPWVSKNSHCITLTNCRANNPVISQLLVTHLSPTKTLVILLCHRMECYRKDGKD